MFDDKCQQMFSIFLIRKQRNGSLETKAPVKEPLTFLHRRSNLEKSISATPEKHFIRTSSFTIHYENDLLKTFRTLRLYYSLFSLGHERLQQVSEQHGRWMSRRFLQTGNVSVVPEETSADDPSPSRPLSVFTERSDHLSRIS